MDRRKAVARFAVVAATAGVAVVAVAAPASADIQYYGYDLNGDGYWETYITDYDGDGAFDTAIMDLNLDGIQDGLAHDWSHNGHFDMFGIDGNQNGHYEIMGVDRDDNGDIDWVAIDRNENGVEDSAEQLYPTIAYVGGTPTYNGTGYLLNTLAEMSGRATFGSGDFDKDGVLDPDDADDLNPRRW
jgi:hypothetical protein